MQGGWEEQHAPAPVPPRLPAPGAVPRRERACTGPLLLHANPSCPSVESPCV